MLHSEPTPITDWPRDSLTPPFPRATAWLAQLAGDCLIGHIMGSILYGFVPSSGFMPGFSTSDSDSPPVVRHATFLEFASGPARRYKPTRSTPSNNLPAVLAVRSGFSWTDADRQLECFGRG